MANNVDSDQTAPIGAVCSGSTLLAFIINSSVMLSNYSRTSLARTRRDRRCEFDPSMCSSDT